MQIEFYPASERGFVNFGWLQSFHTFSFGEYYNPQRMGFGALRVINDDVVQGGKGFAPHAHDNMEIISVPLQGALKHEDSAGNVHVIRAGDVQVMSAGKGITHSEYNYSPVENVNFLQIWILPKQQNVNPRYQQAHFLAVERKNKWQCIVSPAGQDNSLKINQDAYLYLSDAEAGVKLTYPVHHKNNKIFLLVLEGLVHVAERSVARRDAVAISSCERLAITVIESAQLLLIEVPE